MERRASGKRTPRRVLARRAGVAVIALGAALAGAAYGVLSPEGERVSAREAGIPATPSGDEKREPPADKADEGPADAPAPDPDGSEIPPESEQMPRINYRQSKARGKPWDGKLKRGTRLTRWGEGWFSWDPIEKQYPNRQWRRWATDDTIRTTVRVIRKWKQANPNAPDLPIGDLSRPKGGDFGPQFGSIGHASHQNGLDVDIYYPRKDRKPQPPNTAKQVRVKPSQDLVDRFVEAGAEKIFVGPNLPLTGPEDIVIPLVHHDNHIHVRFPKRSR